MIFKSMDELVRLFEMANPGDKVAICADYSDDWFILLAGPDGKIEFSTPWLAVNKHDATLRHFNASPGDKRFIEAMEQRAKHYISMEDEQNDD